MSSGMTVHVSDGSSQQQRVLAALRDGYFQVDELRFEQLLALANEYAHLIRFYNLDNQADGLWDQPFAANELIVIATILATDIQQLEAGFQRRLQEHIGDIGAIFHDFQGQTQQLGRRESSSPLGLAQMLDSWMQRLENPQSKAGEDLRALIDSVVVGLRKDLYTLGRLVLRLPQVQAIAQMFSAGFMQQGFGEQVPTTAMPDAEAQTQAHRDALLRTLFSSFVQAVHIIQDGARRALPESLCSGNHDPAVAILVSFVKLYQKLQVKINGFTGQYLDFYYRDILHAQPQALVPDQVHLVMQLSAPGLEVEIARDTEFLAGIDEQKREVIYAADETVQLNDAAVTRLHTLFFPRDASSHGRALANGAWLDQIPAMPDSEPKDRDKMQPFPLLGAPRDGRRLATITNARIGFALASSVLLLREGQRRITVNLQYSGSAPNTLEGQIYQFTQERLDIQDEPSMAEQKETFFKVFGSMFAIALTGPAGWIEIPEYLPSYRQVNTELKANCLVLSFMLPADAPPVCAYNGKIHGEDYDSELPLLRFTLTPSEYQYPYDIIKDLVLKEARIEVAVRGCRELLLHNNIGQLTPLAPFNPFGPLPTVGSYFIVGHEETRTKQLSSFDIDVEWGELPGAGEDFKTWYAGYANPPHVSDFTATVSVLADGRWLPGDIGAPPPITLFAATRVPGRVLAVAKRANLSASAVVHYGKALDNTSMGSDFVYTPATKGGLFKFTLAGPAAAFGHQEYPLLLSQTLTHNSRAKTTLLQHKIPNPPYTPQITSISLNYTAFAVISRDSNDRSAEQFKEKMLHLHPLGWQSLSRLSAPRLYQLPRFDAGGSMVIGLSSKRLSDSLTLYFHLRRDSLPMPVDQDPGLAWAYLSANQWRKLPAKAIISDSTEGFMTSGIITLSLPADISTGNTVLPGDLYWLKVSAQSGLENFCSVYSVYAQAVPASLRHDPSSGMRTRVVLPAGSITRPRKTIAGLSKIAQVCRSFGGKAAENGQHMRTRVSERLRHKQRALTPTDYESLILEQFPEIYKVKCFANTRSDQPDRLCPGHLLIVPLPYLALDGHLHQKPLLSGHLIHEVREYMQTLASPFVTISVENPLYEEIQVRCTVTLRAGLRGGYYSNRVNSALFDFLLPWNPLGYTAHFGWCVRQHDLESYLQDLDYVDQVSDFSLLRVAAGNAHLFTLDDSARRDVDGSRNLDLEPRLPWSVAVPNNHHAIQIADRFTSIEPHITGVEELEIGNTLIISPRN